MNRDVERMDYAAAQSLTQVFLDNARRHADRPLLWAKQEGAYRSHSWSEVEQSIRLLSLGLRALGVAAGERVLLISENRPEWFVSDFAIMAARAITVPAYTTYMPRDLAHLLRDSGARVAIVSTSELAKRLFQALPEAPDCRVVIAIDQPEGEPTGAELLSWEATMALGREQVDDVDETVAASRREETACLIYTSGSGGEPKGVMLSHGNILCNCLGAYDLLAEDGLSEAGEVFLSFLPLSHSYEHTAGHAFPMTIAAEIYYAEGVETLPTNLAEARPTIMTAVPRLYESMHQRIRLGLRRQSRTKRWLFAEAERLGRKRYHDPASLGLIERMWDRLLDRLVRDKLRARFGGRLKAMISGGAPLNPDIGIFFQALGLRVLQGYGQTEAAPVISANRPRRIKMHTVGPPLKGVEVRIADDGEILVRGELVMQGYWQRPEDTAAALQDGWLHTGDIGEIDAEGYIVITDRKKDILVLTGGDNVSPTRLEGLLTLQPEIAQAFVYGDRRPHLVALVVPDQDWLQQWARRHGRPADLSQLCEDKALNEAIGTAVERTNQQLPTTERLRRFLIAEGPFTVDNRMMTPTLKVRRHIIRDTYAERLEALYARPAEGQEDRRARAAVTKSAEGPEDRK